MAYKIFKKGNYIHIVDTLTLNLIEENASDVFISKATQASTTYNIDLKRSEPMRNIALADIQDEAGAAYVQAAWETFYQDNTGFNPATASGASQVASDLAAHESNTTPHIGSNLTTRENVADFVNLTDPSASASSFTAAWGNGYRVDASAGNILIPLALVDATNANKFIQIHRVDNSANKVVVIAATGQNFFQILGQTDSNIFEVKKGGTVNVRSIGTLPVVTNYDGVSSVSRLWLPTDAGADPVVWYNLRDATGRNLTGSTINQLNNLGTLGSAWNLPSVGAATALINNQHADFAGGYFANAVAQATMATSALTFAMMYQQTSQEANSLFAQSGLASRFSIHPKWSDGNTYVDMPIASRISANLGSSVIGATPHVGLGRKGANREYFVDGNTSPAITAVGGGTALSGSSVLSVGSENGVNLFSGNLYELIFFNYDLTNDERDRLSAYMMWAIGQQALISASNPYKNTPPLVIQRTF